VQARVVADARVSTPCRMLACYRAWEPSRTQWRRVNERGLVELIRAADADGVPVMRTCLSSEEFGRAREGLVPGRVVRLDPNH